MSDIAIFLWTIGSLLVIFVLWWALTDLRARTKERREDKALSKELEDLLRREDEDA